MTARAAAVEAAVLAHLASAGADVHVGWPPVSVWSTGAIERAVFRRAWLGGYSGEYTRLLGVLNRLHRRGRLAKYKPRASYSAHWRPLPDEGNCDAAGPAEALACQPGDCFAGRGGCQSCLFWAARNLGRPLWRRP